MYLYLRSDLPSMRRVIFPPTIVCFVGEQNHEEYGPQSKQYLHSWDKWYPSHASVGSVGLTHKDACTCKGEYCKGLVREAILESHITWGSTWGCAYKKRSPFNV